MPIPFLGYIYAGFASPVDEDLADIIHIEDYVVRDKNASFLLRMQGDRFQEHGICHGDLIIFERGTVPKNNQLAIVFIEGEGHLIVHMHDAQLSSNTQQQIIGTVISVIRKYV